MGLFPSMTGNSKRDIELFTEAIQLPHEERIVFLDRVCGEDEGRRRRIQALLKSNDRAGDFLETPPTGAIRESRAKTSAGEKPGDRVCVGYGLLAACQIRRGPSHAG